MTDRAVDTLVAAIPAGVRVLSLREARFRSHPSHLPIRDAWAGAVVAEGPVDFAELRRISTPGATWVLFVPNALRKPEGLHLEALRYLLSDRPYRLYSRVVLAGRGNLADRHADVLLLVDEWICILAGTRT